MRTYTTELTVDDANAISEAISQVILNHPPGSPERLALGEAWNKIKKVINAEAYLVAVAEDCAKWGSD